MLVVIIQIVALYFAMGFMYSAGCMRGGMAEKKARPYIWAWPKLYFE